MSIKSAIDDLVINPAATSLEHTADSVKDFLDYVMVDPFKKHTGKMADRAVFEEGLEQFSGGKVGKGRLANLNNILADVKADKEIASYLEDIYADVGGASKQELRANTKMVKKLADQSEALFKGMKREAVGHIDTLDVLRKEYSEAVKAVNEGFSKHRNTLRTATGPNVNIASATLDISTPELKAQQIKLLQTNQEATLAHLKDVFKEKAEVHELAITELKSLSKEIEEVAGVTNKHGFAKAAGESVAKELSMAEKGAAAEEKVANGGFGAVKVVKLAGAGILSYDGVRRITASDSTGTDMAVGAAELAGGGYLAWSALAKKAANAVAHTHGLRA